MIYYRTCISPPFTVDYKGKPCLLRCDTKDGLPIPEDLPSKIMDWIMEPTLPNFYDLFYNDTDWYLLNTKFFVQK